MGEFADKVFAAVCEVPRGKVATYGQIAALVGRPRSARYVGFALRSNPRPGADADSIPCHRIVFKDGRLCESFAFGGADVQFLRLQEEGVRFVEAGRDEAASGGATGGASGGRVASDDGAAIEVDLDDGCGVRPVRLADIRVDMQACQWNGCTATGGGHGMEDDEREGYPTEPPDFFDWNAELGE